GLRHRRIVRRRPVDERHGEHVLGPESLEPANTVVPGAFVIVIRRGGGRDDPDLRGESTGLLDAAQVGIAHAPAKLCAALQKQISHAQILRQSRAAWTRWTWKGGSRYPAGSDRDRPTTPIDRPRPRRHASS